MKNKSFRNDEHGVVTIYTIMIIVPIFVLQAVLIDFVRIKVASFEAEQATRAAARSVLSAYDKQLLPFGLFGLKANSEQQQAIANDVLSKYGTNKEQSNTFHWLTLNPLLDQTRVIPTYNLSDHRLFRQQILEDMKYKAPIEFSRNIFNKWKGRKDIITNTESKVQLAEELDTLLHNRENRLMEAFQYVELIHKRIKSVYADYDQKFAEEMTKPDKEFFDHNATSDFSHLQDQYRKMNSCLIEAENIEQEIQKHIKDEQRGLVNDIYILGHEFYSDYNLGTTNAISLFGAFLNQLQVTTDVSILTELHHQYYDAFESWFSIRSNEQSKRVAAYKQLEQQKQEQRKKLRDQMDNAKQTMSSQRCPHEQSDQYEQLATANQRYLMINRLVEGLEYDPTFSLEQTTDQYQRHSLSLLSNLADLTERIRDEAYVNEYALYHFNHRTSSLRSDESFVDKHTLQDQEVEFIVYGMPSCSANRIAAYAEMYMIRFAIRLVEALTDANPIAVGSPLLMVLMAATEGASKAYKDMGLLIQGGEVPVFTKWGALTLTYEDYLRMFLLIHNQEEKKLARIQALIELNTSIKLNERPVYIELKSITTMNMWFRNRGSYKIVKSVVMSY